MVWVIFKDGFACTGFLAFLATAISKILPPWGTRRGGEAESLSSGMRPAGNGRKAGVPSLLHGCVLGLLPELVYTHLGISFPKAEASLGGKWPCS